MEVLTIKKAAFLLLFYSLVYNMITNDRLYRFSVLPKNKVNNIKQLLSDIARRPVECALTVPKPSSICAPKSPKDSNLIS